MTSRVVQYARYGGPEVLEIVEREDPTPGEGQVRLVVRAASINPIDWKIRSGTFSSTDAPDAPATPGVDLAGVVDAVGPGVTSFGVGDEVLGHGAGGTYAEMALADAGKIVAKPAGLSWDVAGALPVVVTTAYRVLAQLGLGSDDDARGRTLVVDGASGGVGIIAAQVAVARGATVVGSAGEKNQELVRELGATPVVYGDGLADRVRATLGPDTAVDAALDTAGKGSLPDLIALTGSPDRVITIADPTAGEHGVLFSGGSADQEVPGALADAVSRVATGELRPPETVVYPLDQAGRAQEDNRTGKVSGKLVLQP